MVDVLWRTGLPWAQAKARQLFDQATRCVQWACGVSAGQVPAKLAARLNLEPSAWLVMRCREAGRQCTLAMLLQGQRPLPTQTATQPVPCPPACHQQSWLAAAG